MTSSTADQSAGTVLITGASRGLGAGLADAFDAAGYRVIAAIRSPDMRRQEPRLRHVRLDVADEASIAALADKLAGEPVDILINNAAIRGDTGGLDTLTSEDFLKVMRVNALAPLLVTRALLPNLKTGRRKLVVNISSRAGSLAEGTLDDDEGDYAYRLSKAALNMATVKLAQDLRKDGVTVLSLHPGWVKTDMGGSDAPLDPKESVRGLLAQILAATPSDSGGFRSFDGRTIAW